jgi:hypothetical protein
MRSLSLVAIRGILWDLVWYGLGMEKVMGEKKAAERDAIRARHGDLGIDEWDVTDAVAWARSRSEDEWMRDESEGLGR